MVCRTHQRAIEGLPLSRLTRPADRNSMPADIDQFKVTPRPLATSRTHPLTRHRTRLGSQTTRKHRDPQVLESPRKNISCRQSCDLAPSHFAWTKASPMAHVQEIRAAPARGNYGFGSNHRAVQPRYPAEPLQEHPPGPRSLTLNVADVLPPPPAYPTPGNGVGNPMHAACRNWLSTSSPPQPSPMQ